ncbi:hypothetical protein HDU76_002312 [Blyttiomyces sp. JEL0837]|nr:hypothetical protein HDU76_002312 [Blyttiomyces sp. JEL0837]
MLSTFPDISTFSIPYTEPIAFATAVADAAANGHLDVVKLLLKFRGDVDVGDALPDAARRGNLEIVKTLLMIPGVNIAANNDQALAIAATKQHF